VVGQNRGLVEYVHAPVIVEPTTHEEMYVVRDEDGNMTSVVKTGYGDESEAALVPASPRRPGWPHRR
jgi:hypothetical protein